MPIDEKLRDASIGEIYPALTSIHHSSTLELLSLYGEILAELTMRNIIRTGNSPVGDYAELLFSRAFGWTLESNSAAGHDAIDTEKTRYQIKARRLATPKSSRQLSALRKLDQHAFDYVAAVLFDPSFRILRAAIIPHSIVLAGARHTLHTNSWKFMLEDRVWKNPQVKDVTSELMHAAQSM